MTDISDHLDALHADPSPVARIVSRLLDDVTGRNGWDGEWEAMDSDTQAEILTDWQQIVNDVLAEADTTVSPSGMIRIHVHPSGGDRARMAAEARTVIAALTQAFTPKPENEPTRPELQKLRIYGVSDDLVEVEGYIRKEFDAVRPIVLVLTAPDGARLWITAQFWEPPLRGVGNGWAIGALHADNRWRGHVDPTNADRPEDPALVVHVPVGTTVAEWSEERSPS